MSSRYEPKTTRVCWSIDHIPKRVSVGFILVAVIDFSRCIYRMHSSQRAFIQAAEYWAKVRQSSKFGALLDP